MALVRCPGDAVSHSGLSGLSQGHVVPLVPGLGCAWGWVGSAAQRVGGPRAEPPLFCAVLAALHRAPGCHERALVLLQPQQHCSSLPFTANKLPVLGREGGAPTQPSLPRLWQSPGLLLAQHCSGLAQGCHSGWLGVLAGHCPGMAPSQAGPKQ